MPTSETPDEHPVRVARKAKDWTQGELAEEAGCSVSLISMVESGYRPPRRRRDAIAGALERGEEELFG
jgi:transcriptional regulator with XRE-family HTH domain